MTLTQDDIEKILQIVKSIVITSAGDPSRDINRVTFVENIPTPATPLGKEGEEGGKELGIGDIIGQAKGANADSIISSIARFAGPAGIALTTALMLPQIIDKVVDELQRPGGILDKRVKIDSRKEAFAELDRQTRQNTRIGDRQVIIQQFEGFRNFEGHASTNTSRMIRENADRVLDIGLLDRAQGI